MHTHILLSTQGTDSHYESYWSLTGKWKQSKAIKILRTSESIGANVEPYYDLINLGKYQNFHIKWDRLYQISPINKLT